MVRFDYDQEKFVDVKAEWKDNKLYVDGVYQNAYVTTYTSVGGPKAVLLSWDDECQCYTPWNTWYAAKDMDAAWKDALSWAYAEELPAVRG